MIVYLELVLLNSTKLDVTKVEHFIVLGRTQGAVR
jgi:hypothetical protein